MEEEKLNDKHDTKRKHGRSIVYFSIGLFIFGTIVISLTYTPLWQAYQWEQHPTCDNDMLICKTNHGTYTNMKTGGLTSEIIDEVYYNVTFSSRGVFSVNDKINYKITLNPTKITTIEKFYFAFIKEKELPWLMTFSPYEVFQKNLLKNRLIEVPFVSANKFYIEDVWQTPSIPANIIVIGYSVQKENSIDMIIKSDVMFSTVPQEVKVQDTANQEARITNKAVLGLTGIGIGLAFMLLGADFLVRAYLKE